MTVHIIFYVKLDAGLTRKLTLVTDRNKVNTPPLMRYSYILSRVSVIIVLMIDTINVIDLKCANIQNVQFNSKPKEHIYFYARKEFGKDWGKVVVVVRALYGLKSDGSACAAATWKFTRDLGFQPCIDYDDVWTISAVDTSAIESGDISLKRSSINLTADQR